MTNFINNNLILFDEVMAISIDLISGRLKVISDLVSSRRLRRIPVITKSGEIIGRIREVRMNSFVVEGIIIERPFSFSYTFIDKAFVKVFKQQEVVLNINPVTFLRGLYVYDKSGRKLGKVRKVLRDNINNDFKSLVVKDKFYSKSILIEKDKIDIMKKNIILNIDYLEHTNSIKKQQEREKRKK